MERHSTFVSTEICHSAELAGHELCLHCEFRRLPRHSIAAMTGSSNCCAFGRDGKPIGLRNLFNACNICLEISHTFDSFCATPKPRLPIRSPVNFILHTYTSATQFLVIFQLYMTLPCTHTLTCHCGPLNTRA